MRRNYKTRMMLLVFTDCLLIGISGMIGFLLYYDSGFIIRNLPYVLEANIILMMCSALIIFLMNFNKNMWRYASIFELYEIIKTMSLAIMCFFATSDVLISLQIPYTVFILIWMSSVLIIGGTRFVVRLREYKFVKRRPNQRNALIIGAGGSGSNVARELALDPKAELYPVAFIDDDLSKQNFYIKGIPVVGTRAAIKKAVKDFQVSDIIIALPSAPKKEIVDIVAKCQSTKCSLKIVPKVQDLIHGKIKVGRIRNVEVEDLLGRDAVQVDLNKIMGYLQHKTVLITGAGGSIGSELSRQIVQVQPEKLLLLGHGENSIYQIEMELRENYPGTEVIPIIADTQDEARLSQIFCTYQPQIVFHAAAHKHVPLMELNPGEAIKNNVLATKKLSELAGKNGVERFIFISSDKAVNPTSIMGATKRTAELWIQYINARYDTIYTAVRFGNVLGSRGSVIPLFKKQIEQGGPVTVTHPEMIRYFMLVPEAVQLVLQAGALAQGGEIFVLDMGSPVKIDTLARDLIRFSGFEPEIDIPIQYTGIRPGEKLYEELLTEEEGLSSSQHNKIFMSRVKLEDETEFLMNVKKLEESITGETTQVRQALRKMIPTYRG